MNSLDRQWLLWGSFLYKMYIKEAQKADYDPSGWKENFENARFFLQKPLTWTNEQFEELAFNDFRF